MGPAEFQLLPGPFDGKAQYVERIGADFYQARGFTRDAIVAVIVKGITQAVTYTGIALGIGFFGQINPDIASTNFDWIGAQPVTTVEVVTGIEIEFPVMPVAGQDAVCRQATLGQRIALMRAAVIAGPDTVGSAEQSDLPTLDAQHFHRLGRKFCQRYQALPVALITDNLIQQRRHRFHLLQKISTQYKS